MKLETVKVEAETEQGYMIINKDDFDKEKHKEFKESKPKQPKKDKS